jgi:Flp pilus assembly protein TadG
MMGLLGLVRSTRGAAAAEMALVTPLLLILMMGSFEVGNYFMDEHKLVKAVRDGARFAGRQSFTNYTCPGGTTPGGTVVADTQNVVKTGLLSGGTARLPKTWTINVTFTCKTDLSGGSSNPPSGIYKPSSGSAYAPVVTVTATVPYMPLLASYGFRGIGLNLYATQQSAVMGL